MDAYTVALRGPPNATLSEVLELEYEAGVCTEELLSAEPVPIPQWELFTTGQCWGTAV